MPGGQTLDPTSEQIILSVDQPFGNHNGGGIAFGNDGYLYIGFGDGGSGGDPLGNGQNTNTLLGAFLRIDVDGSAPYTIPPDNPFAAGGGRPEIYAYGFRNPWRWSFDRGTGDLWAGDVGQGLWEEVDRVALGGNYGWDIMEGSQCYNAASCDSAGMLPPIAEYSHAEGCSVTGGYVYRGADIPQLEGTYVYGDYCSGRIWGVFYNPAGGPFSQVLLDSGRVISSFAEGHDGELYLLDYTQGSIYRLVDAGSLPPVVFPQFLSETGCVDPADPTQPAPAMIPYDLNVPFWSDRAAKLRWLALPNGTTIEVSPEGDWVFPIGTVLMKTFSLNGKRVETRIMARHSDGDWGGYSFEWDDAQTDAAWVVGGKSKWIGQQEWEFPSTPGCLRCHTAAAGRSLGPETAQMNRDFTYPSTGRTDNQLATFDAIGLFSSPLPEPPENLPVYPRLDDLAANPHARARAWLHSNCSHCHRPGGTTNNNIDLLYASAFSDMGICGVVPSTGDLGISGASIFAPRDPARSTLWARAARRDAYGMPPLGSNLTDPTGLALVTDWIATTPTCDCIQPPLTLYNLNLGPGLSQHAAACSIIVGPNVSVPAGARLVLQAPVVVLESGVSIGQGGRLEIFSP